MSARFESVTVTPVCYDGTIASASSVVFNFTEVKGAVAKLGGSAILRSVFLHDSNDNGKFIRVFVSRKGINDLGTLASAIDITDAEAIENDIIGVFVFPVIGSSGTGDLVNSSVASVNPDIVISSDDVSSSIYIAAISEAVNFVSTPSGLRLTLGFERM